MGVAAKTLLALGIGVIVAMVVMIAGAGPGFVAWLPRRVPHGERAGLRLGGGGFGDAAGFRLLGLALDSGRVLVVRSYH